MAMTAVAITAVGMMFGGKDDCSDDAYISDRDRLESKYADSVLRGGRCRDGDGHTDVVYGGQA